MTMAIIAIAASRSLECCCARPIAIHIALMESFMIGDRWRDIEAGRRAGCRTILIGNGYGEELKTIPDAVVATLGDAADWILALAR